MSKNLNFFLFFKSSFSKFATGGSNLEISDINQGGVIDFWTRFTFHVGGVITVFLIFYFSDRVFTFPTPTFFN